MGDIALTDEQLDRLAELLAEKMNVSCSCGLSSEARSEMVHFMGMLKDVGGGSHAGGVEVIRLMSIRFSSSRRIAQRILDGVILSAVLGVGGWVVYLVGQGLADWVRGIR